MALIHQKLYQTEGVSRIPMKAYIEEVVAYLQDTYALSQQVGFKLYVEHIELDVNLAVPLGLIINEAITNAFKYAFPNESSGVVGVSLLKQSDTLYELTIADDGIGLPEGYDASQSRSLGMTLIHGFSAQLGGELTIEGSEGVKLSLLFAEEKLSPIHNQAAYAY
jgi:two-component sensor histidine kinase